MYNKVMVPLDGSQLAECSLEHVKTIATGCHVTEVVLLRAVEPLSANEISALSQVRGNPIAELEELNQREATKYIGDMTEKLNKAGINTLGEVINGKAADIILDYTAKKNVNLIIMSTHGRSGISRWAFGSVADKVARSSAIPVLLVSPAGCRIDKGNK
jgi:nucleotide-binding universal stress UspA family protein